MCCSVCSGIFCSRQLSFPDMLAEDPYVCCLHIFVLFVVYFLMIIIVCLVGILEHLCGRDPVIINSCDGVGIVLFVYSDACCDIYKFFCYSLGIESCKLFRSYIVSV